MVHSHRVILPGSCIQGSRDRQVVPLITSMEPSEGRCNTSTPGWICACPASYLHCFPSRGMAVFGPLGAEDPFLICFDSVCSRTVSQMGAPWRWKSFVIPTHDYPPVFLLDSKSRFQKRESASVSPLLDIGLALLRSQPENGVALFT